MPNPPALQEWIRVRTDAAPLCRFTILVDSRDRDASRFPTPTDYEVELPHTLHKVTSAYLIGAEVPSSFSPFQAKRGNTTFTWDDGASPQTATIPDGHYTAATLIETLNEVLPVGLSATLHPVTQKTTLTGSGSITIHPTGLAPWIGFPESAHGTSITGTRPVNARPETYLIVDIEGVGNLHECEVNGRGGTQSLHTFAKIPLLADPFGTTFQDHTFGTSEISPPIHRLSKLRIHWRFHDGTPVDFQGVDHALTLEFLAMKSRSV